MTIGRPPVAEDVDGAGDRAVPVIEAGATHVTTLVGCLNERTLCRVNLMNERTIRLRGGQRVTVRPMTSADADAVLAGFHHLSPSSLRHRFFSPVVRLTPAVAADLVAVDDQHLVLLAFDSDGRLVGGARATRHRDDPATADVAITVGDAHQRQGLGTKLLRFAACRCQGRRHRPLRRPRAARQRRRSGARWSAAHAACWFAEPGVLGFEIPLGRRTVAPAIAARRTLRIAS